MNEAQKIAQALALKTQDPKRVYGSKQDWRCETVQAETPDQSHAIQHFW